MPVNTSAIQIEFNQPPPELTRNSSKCTFEFRAEILSFSRKLLYYCRLSLFSPCSIVYISISCPYLLLSRIEGLKSFLENNSLENFQQEILNVENYLKRFGSLAELLSHLENVEKIAYAAKEFLNIDEVAAYLQVSKGYVYKLTMQKELTVYKPNGKNIFILRDDLNRWIKRNPCFSNTEIERQANIIAYTLGQKSKNKPTKGGKK